MDRTVEICNRLILAGRAANWRAYCQLVQDIPWSWVAGRQDARQLARKPVDASWDDARVYPCHPAKTYQRPSYGRLEPIVHMGRY